MPSSSFCIRSAAVILVAILQIVVLLVFLLVLLLVLGVIVLLALVVLIVHGVIVLSVKLHENPFGSHGQYDAVRIKIFTWKKIQKNIPKKRKMWYNRKS